MLQFPKNEYFKLKNKKKLRLKGMYDRWSDLKKGESNPFFQI